MTDCRAIFTLNCLSQVGSLARVVTIGYEN